MRWGICRACSTPILLSAYQVRNSVYICRPCGRSKARSKVGRNKGHRPVMDRFWEKVDLSGGVLGCWPWLAAIGKHGYGTFWTGERLMTAHGASYTLLRGPIAAPLVPDHLCHNVDPDCLGGDTCPHRRCVNPWHMEPVTRGVNVMRGKTRSARNAAKSVCPEGHAYTPENTYTDSRRSRHCKACRLIANRQYYRRHRLRLLEDIRQRRRAS